MAKDVFSALLTSIYLLVFSLLLVFQDSQRYAFILFAFSPLLVGWMVYSVLRSDKYDGQELGDREYGYHDKRE